MIVVIIAMITTSPRTHAVAAAPTTIVITVGFVIAAVVSNASLDANTSYGASTEQQ
jgi:hypothetical protein